MEAVKEHFLGGQAMKEHIWGGQAVKEQFWGGEAVNEHFLRRGGCGRVFFGAPDALCVGFGLICIVQV